ncbi:MAG: ABC transporter permease [Sarcina sp.]
MIFKSLRKAKFVWISMTMIILFVFVLGGSVNSLKNLFQEENGVIPRQNVAVTFDSHIKDDEFKDILKRLENDKNLILNYGSANEFSSYESNVYGIYYDENFELGFNLIEGRYFSKEEIRSEEKLAVIGQGMIKFCLDENGVKYIFRGNDRYKVIGIIGNEKNINKEATYDYTIIYNLNSILNSEHFIKDFWDIGSNLYSQDEIISKLISIVGNDKISGISFYEGLFPNPLEAAIGTSLPLIINCFFIIICLILTLLRAIVYWIEYLKLEFGVRLAFGSTKKGIMKIILERCLLIYMGATFSALIINWILRESKINGIFNYEIGGEFLIYSFIFLVILSILIIPFINSILSKAKISQLLKENR